MQTELFSFTRSSRKAAKEKWVEQTKKEIAWKKTWKQSVTDFQEMMDDYRRTLPAVIPAPGPLMKTN